MMVGWLRFGECFREIGNSLTARSDCVTFRVGSGRVETPESSHIKS